MADAGSPEAIVAAAAGDVIRQPVTVDADSSQAVPASSPTEEQSPAKPAADAAAADTAEASNPAAKVPEAGLSTAAADNSAAADAVAAQNGGEAAAGSPPSKANKRNKKGKKSASPAPAAAAEDAAEAPVPASASEAPSAAPAAPAPAAAAAAGAEAAPAAERKSSSGVDLPDGSVPSVKALKQQLKQNGAVALSGGIAQPAAPEPRPEAPAQPRVSEHDRANTTNALELLQTGAFKLLPGKDTVPYEQLVSLRLEDGIDVTRKEEYLSAADFSEVFKMDKAAFEQLPQWKRLQLKKSSRLF